MPEVVIIQAVRTPVGRHAGALASVRPDDLAALVIGEVVKRAGVDPALVEEVYMGCANQAGEDNRNVARMALLLAGLPHHVAGVTFNRLCASGLTAINQAARAIKCGEGQVFIAGGVESMSRAPVRPQGRVGLPVGQPHRLRYDAGLALPEQKDGSPVPAGADGRDGGKLRRASRDNARDAGRVCARKPDCAPEPLWSRDALRMRSCRCSSRKERRPDRRRYR